MMLRFLKSVINWKVKAVDPFVSNPTPAPSYKLNDRFYSKDWAGYTGTPSQFK